MSTTVSADEQHYLSQSNASSTKISPMKNQSKSSMYNMMNTFSNIDGDDGLTSLSWLQNLNLSMTRLGVPTPPTPPASPLCFPLLSNSQILNRQDNNDNNCSQSITSSSATSLSIKSIKLTPIPIHKFKSNLNDDIKDNNHDKNDRRLKASSFKSISKADNETNNLSNQKNDLNLSKILKTTNTSINGAKEHNIALKTKKTNANSYDYNKKLSNNRKSNNNSTNNIKYNKKINSNDNHQSEQQRKLNIDNNFFSMNTDSLSYYQEDLQHDNNNNNNNEYLNEIISTSQLSSSSSSTTSSSSTSISSNLSSIDYRMNSEIKPPYSYATLICMAMKANKNKMTLSSIYKWIKENFLYYKNADPNWQNSIRHNLSLNKCFIKIARNKDEPGKGGFWKLDPIYADSLIDGVFKKRRSTTVQSGTTSINNDDSTLNLIQQRKNNNCNIRSNNSGESIVFGGGGVSKKKRKKRQSTGSTIRTINSIVGSNCMNASFNKNNGAKTIVRHHHHQQPNESTASSSSPQFYMDHYIESTLKNLSDNSNSNNIHSQQRQPLMIIEQETPPNSAESYGQQQQQKIMMDINELQSAVGSIDRNIVVCSNVNTDNNNNDDNDNNYYPNKLFIASTIGNMIECSNNDDNRNTQTIEFENEVCVQNVQDIENDCWNTILTDVDLSELVDPITYTDSVAQIIHPIENDSNLIAIDSNNPNVNDNNLVVKNNDDCSSNIHNSSNAAQIHTNELVTSNVIDEGNFYYDQRIHGLVFNTNVTNLPVNVHHQIISATSNVVTCINDTNDLIVSDGWDNQWTATSTATTTTPSLMTTNDVSTLQLECDANNITTPSELLIAPSLTSSTIQQNELIKLNDIQVLSTDDNKNKQVEQNVLSTTAEYIATTEKLSSSNTNASPAIENFNTETPLSTISAIHIWECGKTLIQVDTNGLELFNTIDIEQLQQY